jgi:hypothetical protein
MCARLPLPYERICDVRRRPYVREPLILFASFYFEVFGEIKYTYAYDHAYEKNHDHARTCTESRSRARASMQIMIMTANYIVEA